MVSFSSEKLIRMGFSFKYSLEEMYRGAIDSCREKGLLPLSTQVHTNGENLNSQEKQFSIDNQEKEFLPASKIKQEIHSGIDNQEKESLPTSEGKHSEIDNQEKELLPAFEKKLMQANGNGKCV